jgi:hypothetical protein
VCSGAAASEQKVTPESVGRGATVRLRTFVVFLPMTKVCSRIRLWSDATPSTAPDAPLAAFVAEAPKHPVFQVDPQARPMTYPNG